MKKSRFLLLVFSALVLAAFAYLLLAPVQQVPEHPFFVEGAPIVIAHRGGSGLWPENTLYAFERAADLGVDVLEMDVQASADGQLMVFHDENLHRTTNGQGRVEDKTREQLKMLDAGYDWTNDGGASHPYRGQGIRIPTLEDVLEAFPAMRLNIEIKTRSPAVAVELCRVLRQHSRQERVIVASFDDSVMDSFRAQCPETATAATWHEVRSLLLLSLVFMGRLHRPNAEAYQVPPRIGSIDLVSSRFVREAHRHHIQVHVWTIADVQEMDRLLRVGVDGIMTPYPDRLLSLTAN